jgi:DNA-binding MarR family transcriptional regulator
VNAKLPAQDAALLRRFGRELASAGGLLAQNFLGSDLTLGGARCLYEIGAAGELSVSAVADRCDLDLGYVSRVVSQLAHRRLVEKARSSDDGRARVLTLTPDGERLLASLEDVYDGRLLAWASNRPAQRYEALRAGIAAFLGEPAAEVVFRNAKPGDVGRIIQRHAEIYCGEFRYPPAFEAYVVQAFASFFNGWIAGRECIVVAERGGAFAGCVAVKVHSEDLAQLRFLIVEPSARGKGIGKRLVEMAVTHAKQLGCAEMFLETASDLSAARSIYAAEGFRQAENQPVDWLPAGVLSETWTLDLRADFWVA